MWIKERLYYFKVRLKIYVLDICTRASLCSWACEWSPAHQMTTHHREFIRNCSLSFISLYIMASFALSFLYLPLIHLSLSLSLFLLQRLTLVQGHFFPSGDRFSTRLTKIDESPIGAKQVRGKRGQIKYAAEKKMLADIRRFFDKDRKVKLTNL